MAKKFGVSMAKIEKLRGFQRSLMEKKVQFNESMDFINFVQLTVDNQVVPALQRLSVANNRMYFDDGMIMIPCSKISNKIIREKGVILEFRVPVLLPPVSKLSLIFANNDTRDHFLEAISDLEDIDDSDLSTVSSLTPPNSSESDSN